ncbi:MAG TPA: UDP-N-acetylmuramoyl-L-alanine--D-glutamate ligase [Gemmatimonadales bacterium]|nr:UDP-N-acetylmuramoyl-L-alanine--D-glutamate ligase [Gemmatimonadales bacterium]
MSAFDRWRADGREVAVIGLGKSGIAATRLLRREGLAVYASDAGSGAAPEDIEALRQRGAAVETKGHDLARIAKAQLAVVSPGVNPNTPARKAATEAGVTQIAEAELGLLAMPGVKTACITGTNGKTTTTALTGHLLRMGGLKAVTAGNIGTPLSAVAMEPGHPEWLAVELSSFQLHDMPSLRPTIGALTNLAPDHLDAYASIDEYYADKARLFLNADASSLWISNADDPVSKGMTSEVPGTHLRFSTRGKADAWYDRPIDRLMIGEGPVAPRSSFPLFGDHNVQNALLAMLVADRAGVPHPRIAEGLRTFSPLPHRMEPVREVQGVLWINDSKATNIASTEVAVRGLDRPFILLLGGRHKGEPYTRLAEAAGGKCKAVVAYGESGAQVERDLKDHLKVIRMGSDFDAVLRTAAGLAEPGDAVLLSPACSSYDMFKNYEERGATFRAWVAAR